MAQKRVTTRRTAKQARPKGGRTLQQVYSGPSKSGKNTALVVGGVAALALGAVLLWPSTASAAIPPAPPQPPYPPTPPYPPYPPQPQQPQQPAYNPAQNQPAAPGQVSSMTKPVGGGAPIDSVAGQQNALNLAGASPPLAVDGIRGPKMIAAVIAFQRSHGLVADGVVGTATKNALLDAITQ